MFVKIRYRRKKKSWQFDLVVLYALYYKVLDSRYRYCGRYYVTLSAE